MRNKCLRRICTSLRFKNTQGKTLRQQINVFNSERFFSFLALSITKQIYIKYLTVQSHMFLWVTMIVWTLNNTRKKRKTEKMHGHVRGCLSTGMLRRRLPRHHSHELRKEQHVFEFVLPRQFSLDSNEVKCV